MKKRVLVQNPFPRERFFQGLHLEACQAARRMTPGNFDEFRGLVTHTLTLFGSRSTHEAGTNREQPPSAPSPRTRRHPSAARRIRPLPFNASTSLQNSNTFKRRSPGSIVPAIVALSRCRIVPAESSDDRARSLRSRAEILQGCPARYAPAPPSISALALLVELRPLPILAPVRSRSTADFPAAALSDRIAPEARDAGPADVRTITGRQRRPQTRLRHAMPTPAPPRGPDPQLAKPSDSGRTAPAAPRPELQNDQRVARN